jgi:hypothetical protein
MRVYMFKETNGIEWKGEKKDKREKNKQNITLLYYTQTAVESSMKELLLYTPCTEIIGNLQSINSARKQYLQEPTSKLQINHFSIRF